MKCIIVYSYYFISMCFIMFKLHYLTGFAGSNAIENLELFSIVDAAADTWVHIYDANFHEKNEEMKV